MGWPIFAFLDSFGGPDVPFPLLQRLASNRAGEVLVTSTTRDLTLDAGFDFDEKGTFELKGVSTPRTLYSLRSEG